MTDGLKEKYNPGDIAPKTGKYCVCNAQGNILDKIDVVAGDRLPPTQSEDYYYKYNYLK